MCNNNNSNTAATTTNNSNNDNGIVPFTYTGQVYGEIPDDVTHAIIDESVEMIKKWAFRDCTKLGSVEFQPNMLKKLMEVLSILVNLLSRSAFRILLKRLL